MSSCSLKKLSILLSLLTAHNVGADTLNVPLKRFHEAYLDRDMAKVLEYRNELLSAFSEKKELLSKGEITLGSEMEKNDFELAKNYVNSMVDDGAIKRVVCKYDTKLCNNLTTDKLTTQSSTDDSPEEFLLTLDTPEPVDENVINYLLDNYYKAKGVTPKIAENKKEEDLDEIDLNKLDVVIEVASNENQDEPQRGDATYEALISEIKNEELLEIKRMLTQVGVGGVGSDPQNRDKNGYLVNEDSLNVLKIDVIKVTFPD